MSELALCRTCARPAARLQPLFVHPERYKRYALALKLATGLQVEINDGLPQQICTECSKQVNRVLKFRTNCQKAQTRLFELGYRKNNTHNHSSSSMNTMGKELINQLNSDESLGNDYDGDFSSLCVADVGNLDPITDVKEELHTEKCQMMLNKLQPGAQIQNKVSKGPNVELGYRKNNTHNNSSSSLNTMGKELMNRLKSDDLESDYNGDCSPFVDVANLDPITDVKEELHTEKCQITLNKYEPGAQIQKKLSKGPNVELGYRKNNTHNNSSSSLNTVGKELKNQFNLDESLESDYDGDFSSFVDVGNRDLKTDVKVNLREKRQITLNKYLDTSAPLYTCKECKKIYKHQTSFETHIAIHTGLEFMCDRCGKVFWGMSSLLRHQRAMHGVARDSSLRCPHCEYHGLDNSHFTEHLRTHTGERPYVCDACGAGFTGRELLVQHLSVHMTKKTIQCAGCPAKFKTRHELHAHRWQRHKPRRWRYQCAYCPCVYVTPFNCRKHVRKSHGIPNDQQEKPVRVPINEMNAENFIT